MTVFNKVQNQTINSLLDELQGHIENQEVQENVDHYLTDKESRIQKRKEREENLVIQSGYKKIGIPKRFHDASFETLDNYNPIISESKETLVKYAHSVIEKGYTGSLVMIGPQGNGKTHFAISLLKYITDLAFSLHNTRFTARFSTLNNLFMLAKSFDGGKKEFEAMVHCDFLVIDEFNYFLNNLSDFDKSTLFALFNERYNACKPTVVLSNFNEEQFLNALGDQVRSRLFEDGENILVFNLADYRTRGAK